MSVRAKCDLVLDLIKGSRNIVANENNKLVVSITLLLLDN